MSPSTAARRATVLAFTTLVLSAAPVVAVADVPDALSSSPDAATKDTESFVCPQRIAGDCVVGCQVSPGGRLAPVLFLAFGALGALRAARRTTPPHRARRRRPTRYGG